MKKVLLLLGAALLILIGIVLFNTLRFASKQIESDIEPLAFDAGPEKLSKALTFETISHKPGMRDDSAFVGFYNYIKEAFPLVDSILDAKVINDYSVIYSWKGSDPDKQPLVLTAHCDVVPVEYSSLDQWDAKPFSGAIKNGFIYGRGAIDDKGSLMAILEAVELLLERGVTPERSLIICIGHDEEIGGAEGAKPMAKYLHDKGIRAWMVLDEGGTLATGIVPGIEQTVALIGTSEKGYVSLELSANLPGGHSSMPEKQNSLTAINEAIHQLNEQPLPNRLTDPLEGFVSHVGPHLPFTQKMAFANTWLFKPLIFSVYEKSASGAALIHTTQVATVFNSGIKDNIIPNRAKAIVNYRLLPGDEPEAIRQRAIEIIGDTSVRVIIFNDLAISASPVSDYQSSQFVQLSKIIRSVNPKVLVSPYLVLGATDGRHYYNISDHVFRFSPLPLLKEDLARIHGINERITIEGFKKGVDFYATLIAKS